MKAINAAVATSGIVGHMLAGRRAYTKSDTDFLKRTARRQQRHSLRSALPAEVQRGMEEGVLSTRVPAAVPAKPVPHLFLVPAGKPMGPVRTVTVIEKAAYRRPVVRELRVA